ncbi:chemotaxis protein CheW [Candidatus Woesearchaeota archaeon]|nr:chemotaxis protein CheW [Candidatus Woesearchaeota archaeon]
MQEKQKKAIFEKQIVVFNLGKEEFGVDIGEVREIIRMEQITKIPNTAAYIKGVISLRGGIIVIIDLAMQLGFSPKQTDNNTRIIVIEISNNVVGMIVDSATEVLRLSPDQIQPAPAIITQRINADYIEGVGILGDRLLILLDLSKVLQAKEVKIVENIAKTAMTPEEKPEESKKEEQSKPEEKAQETKKEEHPVLTDVPDGFHFNTHEGQPLKNVADLLGYIKGLSEEQFKMFVNEEKNDFYQWIKHTVKDDDLAEKINGLKSKDDVSKEIMSRIIQTKIEK